MPCKVLNHSSLPKGCLHSIFIEVGFDSIDFGTVSPKAIPQMQDTAAVLAQLDLSQTTSKLLAIIANTRGGNSF
jgi:hydroxymethylglutaryl-CoA lyase